MSTNRNNLCAALSLGIFIAAVGKSGLHGAVDSTMPLHQRTAHEIVTDLTAEEKTINDLLGKENAALKTPADRAALSPKLMPLVHHMSDDLRDLLVAAPKASQQIAGSQMQLLALLSVLGDKEATDQINAMSADSDPSKAVAGAAHQFMARFYISDTSLKSQTELADDLEKLDRAHPDSILLTQLTIEMAHEESFSQVSDRLIKLASHVMDNRLAAALNEHLVAEREAKEQDELLTNKPLTLSGKLVDGSDFSTQSLQGKVVLIDFWASWCGPCKAELPRVKKMFDEYHSKGLEIVGISNDYNVADLKKFIAQAQMPWPELFDEKAAADHEYNSITQNQKIDGIPVMYLIDKKGILRTVNARANMDDLIPKLLAEAN